MNQGPTATTEHLTLLTSTLVPLNRSNVDTDQIIPARFLKGTTKAGLGEKLFYDLRYTSTGEAVSSFVLNQGVYQGSILLGTHNFGCGSSREHAPWALKDFGLKAILAISFADIFRNNSLKNQLLTVELPEQVILELFALVATNPAMTVTIDLPAQEVRVPNQAAHSFQIDAYRKQCLMQGLDDIGYTLSHTEQIDRYEQQ
jgi:3-isopropylmalate/(R)-2-methylmalate dehydratase small subunit